MSHKMHVVSLDDLRLVSEGGVVVTGEMGRLDRDKRDWLAEVSAFCV